MIQSARLRLVPVAVEHTADVARLYSDAEVMRYVTERPLPREVAVESVSKGIRHWAENGFGMFSAYSLDRGEFVGRCGIVKIGTGEVEVAYILAKPFWGQ